MPIPLDPLNAIDSSLLSPLPRLPQQGGRHVHPNHRTRLAFGLYSFGDLEGDLSAACAEVENPLAWLRGKEVEDGRGEGRGIHERGVGRID